MRIKAYEKKRVLVIEPYYGGSHRLFLEGLRNHIPAEYSFLTLPPRKWKMRMQLSFVWLAAEVEKMIACKRKFDVVLSSTFVDLAAFRSLVTSLDKWNRKARFCTYFHENQFAYPGRVKEKELYQFQAMNFTSALVSDRVAFNSSYNMKSFYENCTKYLHKAVDMNIEDIMERIRKKSSVLYPGLDFTDLDALPSESLNDPPVIIWNHRWEHDKNPEEFFSALYAIQDQGIPFKLIVVGQSFRDKPACFKEARRRLDNRILHFGYVKSRHEYVRLLKRADIVVSTARQEFFGISILEAVRAGCTPLLPDKLSYPELFAEKFLYRKGELLMRLRELLCERVVLSNTEKDELTDKYVWQACGHLYERWLFSES